MAWIYSEQARILMPYMLTAPACVFCGVDLESPGIRAEIPNFEGLWERVISTCPNCGWWRITDTTAEEPNSTSKIVRGAAGELKHLDESQIDLSAPIEEVRRFLTERYESRFQLHPRLFEEVVASVFQDLGYKVVITGFASDGGIDMLLHDASDNVVGVQVKRYRSKIKAEQIRSLAGALVLGGQTRGVFVTTSDFSRGAQDTTRALSERGVQIELINARAFYDALGLVERRKSVDVDAPFTHPSLQDVEHWMGAVHKREVYLPNDDRLFPPWSGTPRIVQDLQSSDIDPPSLMWLRCLMVDSEISHSRLVAYSYLQRLAEDYSLDAPKGLSLLRELEAGRHQLLKPYFLLTGDSIREISIGEISRAVVQGSLILDGLEIYDWHNQVAMAWQQTDLWEIVRGDWASYG